MVLNKLIKRQIAKCTSPTGEFDNEKFFALVDSAYQEMDEVRRRTDRASSLMVDEMAVLNEELTSALEKVNRRKGWFKAAMDNIEQGLCLFNKDNCLTLFNEKFAKIYGIPTDKLKTGMHHREVIDLRIEHGAYTGQSAAEYLENYWELVTNNEKNLVVQEFNNGLEVEIRHHPFPDGGFLTTHYDITERRRSERKVRHLAHLANHDSLTSLPNRAQMNNVIEEAIDLAQKNANQMAVLYIDMDGFKHINDTLGHLAGDKLLQIFSERLVSVCDDSGTVGRLSGDEFIIVIPHFETIDYLDSLARNICQIAQEPISLDDQQRVSFGVSVGLSVGPSKGGEYEDLIQQADLALYRAKSEGGNCHSFFTPDMDDVEEQKRKLAIDLRDSVIQDQLILHYQPQLDLRSGKICGYEALVRWQHPELGLIPPDKFIPIAEETGQIAAIGEWVLNTACEYAKNWPGKEKLAVNLSPVQLKQQDITQLVAKALSRSGLAAERLEIEITEDVFVKDSEMFTILIESLNSMGVSLALDDFGTGYSSLSYLAEYPFQKIKMDRSFTKQLGFRHEINAILSAIIGLGKALGAEVTVEGVEKKFQLRMLEVAGCDQAQGYLIGRPQPGIVESFEDIQSLRA